jgi:splicing suppressor protein 51
LEEAINFASWDLFLYTRAFPSMDSDRSLRHVSKLLTFPITIASVLHELSPYKVGKDLTSEGLRSLAALRMTLYPQTLSAKEDLTPTSNEALRVFYRRRALQSYASCSCVVSTLIYISKGHGPIPLCWSESTPPNHTEPFQVAALNTMSLKFNDTLYHDYHE